MKKKQRLSPGFLYYGSMARLEILLDKDVFPVLRNVLTAFSQVFQHHRGILRVFGRWLGVMAFLGTIDASLNLAFAAGGLSGWMSYIISNVIQPGIEFCKWAFYISGIVTIGISINKMIQVSKPQHQGTAVEALAWFAGGGALCGVGYLAQMGQETMSAGNVSGTPT